jgi:sugar phosphate isomerase/epimerase
MNEPRFSVCEITTIGSSFEEDLETYRRAGVEGIGVCEFKLPEGDDGAAVGKLRESGLTATICLPATLSVLPLPRLAGPDDPAERVESICAGIRRLAAFDPVTCICLTGPQGDRSRDEARSVAVEGLREIARTAREAGVGIGLEPIHASIRDDWTLVASLPEALELLEEVGEPNLKIMYDTWHLWDTPDVEADTRAHAREFVGVHVNDRRRETRGWNDRVLPGDGKIDLPALVAALVDGGYDGWYDLEIFSDDGTFQDDYEDSLWKQDPETVVRRGREGFLQAWQAAADRSSRA